MNENKKVYNQSLYMLDDIGNTVAPEALSDCLEKNKNCYFAAMKELRRGNKKTSLEYALIGCENKDASSCSLVSMLDRQNKNKISSLRFSKKACELNSIFDCKKLAEHYISINNMKLYDSYLKKACDLDNYEACLSLGKREKAKNNMAGWYNYTEKGCLLSQVDWKYQKECFPSILKAEIKFLKEDKNKVNTYKLFCGAQDPYYSYVSGAFQYFHGQKSAAKSFFKKGCDLNFGPSCHFLGDMAYRKNKYSTFALEKFQKGCNLKTGYSCALAGMILKDQKKTKMGNHLIMISCEKYKDPYGCLQYGNFLLSNEKDEFNAKEKYVISCNALHAPGCILAGTYYGKEKKRKLSNYFFDKACTLLNMKPCDHMKLLNSIYAEAKKEI